MKLNALACLILIAMATSVTSAQQTRSSLSPVRGPGSNVDWAQFNFDAAHDGYNPYQTILSPANVGDVTLKWSYVPSGGAVEGSPAVVGGVVYFGVENTFSHAYYAVNAVNANTGSIIWNYVT